MSDKNKSCPCMSGLSYEACCEPFHLGQLPVKAEALMRSRYSAYAYSLVDYIMATTHPASSQFQHNKFIWRRNLLRFSSQTQFKGLEILSSQEDPSFATVSFVVYLYQNGQDTTFTERSYFEKIKGKWLYRGGLLAQGRCLELVPSHPLQILPLVYYGDPLLRQTAKAVSMITEDISQLVEKMIETMDVCNGIGLAAPQINHSLQLFIIRKPLEAKDQSITFGDVKVFINPILSHPSEETWKMTEGCLSIPSIQAEVERPREITIEYMDLKGESRRERLQGWEARMVMHENDHIQGILFIDHLSPEERKKIDPLLETLFA